MKTKLIYLLLSVTLFSISCSENQDTSKKTEDNHNKEQKKEDKKGSNLFESEKFHFKIDFKGNPKEKSDKLVQQGFEILYTTFSNEYNKSVFFVAVNELPTVLTMAVDSKTMIEHTISGVLSQLKDSKIISKKDIILDGTEGTELQAEGKYGTMNANLKGRFFIKNDILYQVYGISEKEKTNEQEISEFLNSFSITK